MSHRRLQVLLIKLRRDPYVLYIYPREMGKIIKKKEQKKNSLTYNMFKKGKTHYTLRTS